MNDQEKFERTMHAGMGDRFDRDDFERARGKFKMDRHRARQEGVPATVKDCKQCEQYAKTGGPDHWPSMFCKSGKRVHCTCDVCF